MVKKTMVTNEILERWERGERFHLFYTEDSMTRDILIGKYDECLEAIYRHYDLDDWPINFFLIDITEDLIEHLTDFMVQNFQGGMVH